MDSNLSLAIGFKGQLALNAQAVPMQEGYLKLGGIVDATNQANGLPFGVVVSAPADDPTAIVAGAGSGNTIRGISVFDDAIAQNALGHPGKYLAGMPCAFIAKGLVKMQSWETGKDPVIGYKVQFADATGAIGFVASSADASHTLLAGATVVEVTDDGAYVWLG
ncbi:MAG: hypothetical protein IIZ93_00430 [Acidaminococcaceae bacterium]|nr:hypothetical protein [Acidaminococcaceae bacterium]